MSKFEFNIQNTFLVLQGNLHFSNSCMMMNVFLKKLGDQCDFTKKKFQGTAQILVVYVVYIVFIVYVGIL